MSFPLWCEELGHSIASSVYGDDDTSLIVMAENMGLASGTDGGVCADLAGPILRMLAVTRQGEPREKVIAALLADPFIVINRQLATLNLGSASDFTRATAMSHDERRAHKTELRAWVFTLQHLLTAGWVNATYEEALSLCDGEIGVVSFNAKACREILQPVHQNTLAFVKGLPSGTFAEMTVLRALVDNVNAEVDQFDGQTAMLSHPTPDQLMSLVA